MELVMSDQIFPPEVPEVGKKIRIVLMNGVLSCVEAFVTCREIYITGSDDPDLPPGIPCYEIAISGSGELHCVAYGPHTENKDQYYWAGLFTSRHIPAFIVSVEVID
jgi:hypothetical protein